MHSVSLHYVNSGGVCVCMARGLSFSPATARLHWQTVGCISMFQWHGGHWGCMKMAMEKLCNPSPPIHWDTHTHSHTNSFLSSCSVNLSLLPSNSVVNPNLGCCVSHSNKSPARYHRATNIYVYPKSPRNILMASVIGYVISRCAVPAQVHF